MRFFGTDGIRDLAGEGRLSPENVVRAGRALARFASGIDGRARVCIGRDPRPSGAALCALLADALADAGARVEDLGVVPTPAVAWTMTRGGHDLGIAVSASHNPPAYNGIKPFARGGRKLTVEEEQRIERLMEAANGKDPARVPAAEVDGAARYIEATAAWLGEEGSLDGQRLVVDLSAGAASTTAPEVLRALGADVAVLHEAGTRAINDACGTEHPDAWLEEVVRRGATAGLAFDGDADRVLLADAGGGVLNGDDALSILSGDAKDRGCLPGNIVVSTVMANLGLQERLASFGVRLDRVPVGDRNVAERMRETNAVMGAEPSGHVVLEREGALIGDALVAGVRVLQAAARLARPLDVLREETPRYPQVLKNVRVGECRPLEEYPPIADAIREVERDLEGRGRVVVRYSGTEPLLRIMVEGKRADEVDRAVRRIEDAARGL